MPQLEPARLNLHKAEPNHRRDAPVAGAVIAIVLDQPPVDETQQSVRVQERDAQLLADALWDSLPGGTIDRLINDLLERKTSLFRVGFLSVQELADLWRIRREQAEEVADDGAGPGPH